MHAPRDKTAGHGGAAATAKEIKIDLDHQKSAIKKVFTELRASRNSFTSITFHALCARSFRINLLRSVRRRPKAIMVMAGQP